MKHYVIIFNVIFVLVLGCAALAVCMSVSDREAYELVDCLSDNDGDNIKYIVIIYNDASASAVVFDRECIVQFARSVKANGDGMHDVGNITGCEILVGFVGGSVISMHAFIDYEPRTVIMLVSESTDCEEYVYAILPCINL